VTDCLSYDTVLGGRGGRAVPITGRGGPQGSETSRLPNFLDSSQMAVRSPLRAGRPLPPRKIPGTHFC
jgi:hypothetical protein